MLFSADFFKKIFQEHYQSVKRFGSRRSIGPDLGPKCLQTISADDISQKLLLAKKELIYAFKTGSERGFLVLFFCSILLILMISWAIYMFVCKTNIFIFRTN